MKVFQGCPASKVELQLGIMPDMDDIMLLFETFQGQNSEFKMHQDL